MPHIVVTGEDFVSVPYQPSSVSGLNSRLIVDSGTTVVLNDYEYAALSSTVFDDGALVDGGDTAQVGALGTVVTKAGISPTNGTQTLFSVSGLVKVTELFGVVTTVMDATATTIKLVFDPTVTGAATDLSAAGTVTSDVLGSLYSIVGVAATALTESAAIYLLPAAKLPAEGVILPAGDIKLTGTAANTGVIKWYITYLPIETDAVVTAA